MCKDRVCLCWRLCLSTLIAVCPNSCISLSCELCLFLQRAVSVCIYDCLSKGLCLSVQDSVSDCPEACLPLLQSACRAVFVFLACCVSLSWWLCLFVQNAVVCSEPCPSLPSCHVCLCWGLCLSAMTVVCPKCCIFLPEVCDCLTVGTVWPKGRICPKSCAYLSWGLYLSVLHAVSVCPEGYAPSPFPPPQLCVIITFPGGWTAAV